VWFFDLDDTLHYASHALYGAIDARMTQYIAHHLQVTPAAADALRLTYWQRYGATVLGLVRHHRVKASHFLEHTHAVNIAGLLRAERGLAHMLARLPGRKILLTNAPYRYAQTVLRHLGLTRHFGSRYGIETLRLHGQFRPKPARAMLAAIRAQEKCAPGQAILVDDSRTNLKAARSVGYRTVLITRYAPNSAPPQRPSYVDLQLTSVRSLARRRMVLRS
jgi:putative hydrolase of the HAD superfamily